MIAGLLMLTPWFASAAEEEFTLTIGDQETAVEAPSFETQANQRRSFNFGQVWVGQRRTTDFILGARNFPVRVHGMNVSGRYYDGQTNCPAVLFPGQRCVIRVSYWPGRAGNHYGRMTLWVANDRLTVDLFGRAIGRR